jgi:hypothetical protein
MPDPSFSPCPAFLTLDLWWQQQLLRLVVSGHSTMRGHVHSLIQSSPGS